MLQEPERIVISDTPAISSAITESALEVDAPRRTQLLRQLIETHAWPRVLVFVATKYSTGHVAEKLRRLGLEAGSLHGALSQGARTQVLADFNAGQLQVLVATDIAARGLDFVALPVVINYDLPRSTIIYTHRIGRTGRAGATGEAISFVSVDTFAHFQLVEKRHGKPIPRSIIPGFEPQALPPPLHDEVLFWNRRHQRQTQEQEGQTPRSCRSRRRLARPHPIASERPRSHTAHRLVSPKASSQTSPPVYAQAQTRLRRFRLFPPSASCPRRDLSQTIRQPLPPLAASQPPVTPP
ncbi:MAG: hypothetical protein J6386_09480 [Candidatus Synoicihabitans palmerolidicus]|nr:hypothetical protein [Candidatus Synoicihabitans palmerolidicus]